MLDISSMYCGSGKTFLFSKIKSYLQDVGVTYVEICKCIDSLDFICIISLKTLKNAKYTDYGLYTLLVEEL